MDPIRDDPRFKQMLASGQAAAWAWRRSGSGGACLPQLRARRRRLRPAVGGVTRRRRPSRFGGTSTFRADRGSAPISTRRLRTRRRWSCCGHPSRSSSAWVQDEAAEGRDTGRLVPVGIGGSQPPLGFRQFQSIDLGGWNGSGDPQLGALLDAIAKTGGDGKAASEAPPKRPKRATQQGVHLRPAVRQHERRSRAGIFQRRHHRGHHHRFVEGFGSVGGCPQHRLHVQGPGARREGSRQMLGRQLMFLKAACARRRPGPDHGQLIDGDGGRPCLGRPLRSRPDRHFRDPGRDFQGDRGALRVKLLPEEKKAIETRGTSSVEAYNLYLMARQQWTEGSLGDVRRQETIVRICNQALSLIPITPRPGR